MEAGFVSLRRPSEMDDAKSAVGSAFSVRRRASHRRCPGVAVSREVADVASLVKYDEKGNAIATPAAEWVKTLGPEAPADMQDLKAALLALPSTIYQRVRLFLSPPGKRVRECVLCQRGCLEEDPVLGPMVLLMWSHLDDDGLSVVGWIDWYCAGTVRRRWPGC